MQWSTVFAGMPIKKATGSKLAHRSRLLERRRLVTPVANSGNGGVS